MKIRFLQRLYHRKQSGPDKIARGKGREWRPPRPASTNQRAGAFPTKGSKAKGRAYASQMLVQGGKRRIIKCNCQKGIAVGQEITPKTQPRGAGCLTCNQTPAYIRGSGPLAYGIESFSFFLL
jgi:hypothetical protein